MSLATKLVQEKEENVKFSCKVVQTDKHSMVKQCAPDLSMQWHKYMF